MEWINRRLMMIDQTKLPVEEKYLEISDYREVAQAIKQLEVRGAPAIGVAAAYGATLGALQIKATERDTFLTEFNDIIATLAATRPTAKNLFYALERVKEAAHREKIITEIIKAVETTAIAIHQEEAAATHQMSEYGATLIGNGSTVLTHCNTGPLATTGMGTALGVIIQAHRQGKNIKVFATETRPLCQGARLTTWELKRAGVPVTLITDSMAGHFMKQGNISCAIVGADRIAANGDTANKIGTYSLAVLAKEHGIPFYIAAPATTFDLTLASGEEITIEERKPEEVSHLKGVQLAPGGIGIANPAFDVTPAKYLAAIITEKGIIRQPYGDNIKKIL